MVSSRNILALIVWGGKYNNNNNQPTKAIDLTYLAHLDSKWIFPKAAVYRERHWKSTQRNSELCAGWHLLQSSLFQIRLLHSKRRPEICIDKTLGVTHFCLCVRQKKGGRRRTFSFLPVRALATVADQSADSPVIMLLFHPLTKTSRVDGWQDE